MKLVYLGDRSWSVLVECKLKKEVGGIGSVIGHGAWKCCFIIKPGSDRMLLKVLEQWWVQKNKCRHLTPWMNKAKNPYLLLLIKIVADAISGSCNGLYYFLYITALAMCGQNSQSGIITSIRQFLRCFEHLLFRMGSLGSLQSASRAGGKTAHHKPHKLSVVRHRNQHF